jgi:hypothetical protein
MLLFGRLPVSKHANGCSSRSEAHHRCATNPSQALTKFSHFFHNEQCIPVSIQLPIGGALLNSKWPTNFGKVLI